ncbi:hypothetical protein niasHT_013346 [Heterodera trifolii]|uniref:Neurotransmitter-gated ion-channel ligand-binding domain-containing protein n=1 Tax=Heterodera trifolii TaxID=157864 RepID=A0ABD2L855_9BILA
MTKYLLLFFAYLPPAWFIGHGNYFGHHEGLGVGLAHNYVSKYGIPMNLSEEQLDELKWRPKRHTKLDGTQMINSSGQPNCSDENFILSTLLRDYDKFRIPGGGNVRVEVEIWVQEVSKIIEITSEFELDIYVTEIWTDPLLAFAHLNPCKKNISVDGPRVLPQIWNPLGCFVNSKDAFVHKSPFGNIFLQLYDNGSVWHNYRIKLTGPCANTFNRFPIDQQRCMLFYESFNHNYDQVQMEWTMTPILLLKENITLPDYVLVDHKASSVKRLYPSGVWNELVATFTFQRLYGFYILQDNIPSRTMIGVNSLLSLTYQFGSVVADLPKTSDIKAIDVMILMAMGFIFSSLIELAIVGFLVSNKSNHQIPHKCSENMICWKCPDETAKKIDKYSMIIFPVCFIVFNFWYWFIFMGRLR